MSTEFSFSTFEIIDIILHLLTLAIVSSLFINTHKGDCRGVVVSQKQNPDGHWVTREAKLSMHEAPHELQPLNNNKLASSKMRKLKSLKAHMLSI